jgi:hypothetical protein
MTTVSDSGQDLATGVMVAQYSDNGEHPNNHTVVGQMAARLVLKSKESREVAR